VGDGVSTQAADRLHRVCSADELPPGGRVVTEIRGLTVGVFNVNGDYYAIHDRCPHQGAPLCIGALTGVLEAGGPGFNFTYTRADELVRCPWHGWEFELATGRNISDPKVRVRTFAVHERNGEIFVETRR
jgi:nitrite reductase/ring-hydroxylating ferredoxin subunit